MGGFGRQIQAAFLADREWPRKPGKSEIASG
jgi:hypothetical protein